MRNTVLSAVLLLAVCSLCSAQDAATLIAEYRKLPADASIDARRTRSALLDKLEQLPSDQLIPAIGIALANEKESVRRTELIRLLWDFPSQQTVDLLVQTLSNPDPATRSAGVQALRNFSSRITRRETLPTGPIEEHPPKLPNIVPHLMFASQDTDHSVRNLALYALADSRDPAAVSRFREILQAADPSDQLAAACLLAEFDNPAGLDLLKRALLNLPIEREAQRYMTATRIIPALMRITGQTFGPVPGNPSLSSSTINQAVLKQQFDALIQKWMSWAANPPATAPSAS